jgi:uncharacterized damage-inducible protein DinB
MTTSDNLQAKLQSVLSGDPWYGPSTYSIVEQVHFEAAYEKPPGHAHSIAEIILHMIGWTIEVTERMQGKTATDPAGGDWPDAGKPYEQKWQTMVSDLKLANSTLSGVIQNFDKGKWPQPIGDFRNSALGIGVTYEELVEGLIQHHIYHSGQIALLNRIVGEL